MKSFKVKLSTPRYIYRGFCIVRCGGPRRPVYFVYFDGVLIDTLSTLSNAKLRVDFYLDNAQFRLQQIIDTYKAIYSF